MRISVRVSVRVSARIFVLYHSRKWVEWCQKYGVVGQSPGEETPGDNAACEGFFERMKNEMYYPFVFPTQKVLHKATDGHMQFHNTAKIHAATEVRNPEYQALVGQGANRLIFVQENVQNTISHLDKSVAFFPTFP